MVAAGTGLACTAVVEKLPQQPAGPMPYLWRARRGKQKPSQLGAPVAQVRSNNMDKQMNLTLCLCS